MEPHRLLEAPERSLTLISEGEALTGRQLPNDVGDYCLSTQGHCCDASCLNT